MFVQFNSSFFGSNFNQNTPLYIDKDDSPLILILVLYPLLQAKNSAQQYTSARNGYQSTAQDLKEIEKRTQEAGILLVKTEEEVARARLELEDVTREKLQQETLVKEVKEVGDLI